MASESPDALDLSIVVPVLNEAESLTELSGRLNEVASTLSDRYEIIFVDDGSTDNSFKTLEALQRSEPSVTLVQLRRNQGKAAALAAGFREARGQLIVTIDSDLQDLPEEIPRLVNKLEEGYDLVSGWRVKRRDRATRVLASKIFNKAAGWVTGIELHDINCGLKVYRREVIEELVLGGDRHRYIPVLAQSRGFNVGEVPVEHHDRRYGSSKYKSERYMRTFFDLMTVVMITRYLRRPLHMFGPIGLVTAAAGVGINLYLVIGWLLRYWFLGDRPLLILGTMLIILGVQIVLFGLLAEMVAYVNRGDEEFSIRRKLPARRGSPPMGEPDDR